MSRDPQNPYHSFVVNASAGSGKTYQLTLRYLHLVASHAEISKVLCITFTKKAAEEMRNRVVNTALQFLNNPILQQQFDSKARDFWLASNPNLLQPLSALDTAQKIIHHYSDIDITTMDSLFQRWTTQHIHEATMPLPFEDEACIPNYAAADVLTSTVEWAELFADAQAETVRYLIEELDFAQLRNGEIAQNFSISDFINRAEGLMGHDSFIWSLQSLDNGLHSKKRYLDARDIQSLGVDLKEELLRIRLLLAPNLEKQELIERLYAEPFDAKLFHQIISLKNKSLQNQFLNSRSKIRLEMRDELAIINYKISSFQNSLIQARADLCFDIYRFYDRALQKIKRKKKVMNFSDLVKGAFRIFFHDENIGAQFYIQKNIQHLLVDEFQDTSFLQWSVFQPIVNEILSGEGIQVDQGKVGTFFCVGDTKQSIFGFREADASIMHNIISEIDVPHLYSVELDISYRSSAEVLNFVNAVFERLPLNDFRQHSTAVTFSLEASQTIHVLGNEGDSLFEQEYAHVVNKLVDLHGQGLKWSDCAILFPFSTHVSLLCDLLNKSNIPYVVETTKGLFQQQCISDFIHMLKLMVFSEEIYSLWVLAKSPIFSLQDSDLISTFEVETEQRVDFILQKMQDRSPLALDFIKKLLSHPERFFSSDIIVEGIDFFKQIYTESESIYFDIITDLILDFYKDSSATLLSLLIHFEKLERDHNLNLNAQHSNINAVSLMTIHKSKGLEFQVVFVTDLQRSWAREDHYWIKDLENKTIHYTGTSDEFGSLLAEKKAVHAQRTLEENLRLLYVALTRAKSQIFLSGHMDARSNKVGGYWDLLLEAYRFYRSGDANDDQHLGSVSALDSTLKNERSDKVKL